MPAPPNDDAFCYIQTEALPADEAILSRGIIDRARPPRDAPSWAFDCPSRSRHGGTGDTPGLAVNNRAQARQLLLLPLGQLLVEFGQDLEQIADKAVIGDLEDRRFVVLVNRDDDLRIFHAREVL